MSRKLYPNVDFYPGIVQRAIGIPVQLFTGYLRPGTHCGLIAQLNEMIGDPEYKIGRPVSVRWRRKATSNQSANAEIEPKARQIPGVRRVKPLTMRQRFNFMRDQFATSDRWGSFAPAACCLINDHVHQSLRSEVTSVFARFIPEIAEPNGVLL